MNMENNFYKIEESPLKNHPLYENRGDDLFKLQRQIDSLELRIQKLESELKSES